MVKEADSEIVPKMEEPASRVLSYDIDSLARLSKTKRLELAGEVMARKNTFERLYSASVSGGARDSITSKIALAQLLLAAAEVANGEAKPESSGFSPAETGLLSAFQKYSIFDSLSTAEIIERMTSDEGLRKLVFDLKKNGYLQLDAILQSPAVRRELKLAFKDRFKARLDKAAQCLEAHQEETLETATMSQAAKRESLLERSPRAKASETTGRFITGEDARLSELNFIARFDTKMQDFPLKFYSPVHSRSFEVRSWKEGDHVTEADRRAPDTPWNVRSKYIVRQRKHGAFGDKIPRVVVEAVSYAHAGEYERAGADGRCADLADFLFLIGRFIDQAEIGKYLHVIGAASPTGWDERVLREVQSAEFARNYVSRFVSICLVDSVTGDVAYSKSDDRIARYIEFFKPEFDSEKTERLRNHILGKLVAKGYAVFDDTVQETKESHNLVSKVLYDLEKEGKGRVRRIKEVGLVLQAD